MGRRWTWELGRSSLTGHLLFIAVLLHDYERKHGGMGNEWGVVSPHSGCSNRGACFKLSV